MKKLLAVACMTLMLSACGFKLRGFEALPSWLNNVYIANEATRQELTIFLKDLLQGYHVRVVDNTRDASYILMIDKDDVSQQISGVSASTTPRQYRLMYYVFFHLLQKNGKVIVPESRVAVTRQITVNNNRILGSDYEEALTAREMRREAAGKILTRIIHHESPK